MGARGEPWPRAAAIGRGGKGSRRICSRVCLRVGSGGTRVVSVLEGEEANVKSGVCVSMCVGLHLGSGGGVMRKAIM